MTTGTPVMCGVARSGSTVVWQILRHLFGNEVVKRHPNEWEFDGRPIVSTIRHPFDVAASRYRVRLSRSGIDSGGWIGLEAELDVMKTHYNGLRSMVGMENFVLLRYEDFWNNFEVVFLTIERLFGISIEKKTRDEMGVMFGLEANKKRASTLASFNDIDSDGVHGDHIGLVVPGSWTYELPKDLWMPMVVYCLPIAREWNYESTC